MKIFIILLSTYSSLIFANNCLDQKSENGEYWTRKLGRSQIGKYYQYTSKSISDDETEGWILAKGYALSLLKEECGQLPIGVKAFEQCQTVSDGIFYSYIRYSVDKRKCQTKNNKSSKELTELLIRYKEIQKKAVLKSQLDCLEKSQSCIKSALILFELAEEQKAISLIKTSCNNGISKDCYFIANYYKQISDLKGHNIFLKKACLNSHRESCLIYHKLYKQNKVEDIRGFEKNFCKAGLAEYCSKTSPPEEIEVLEGSIPSFEI